MTSIKKTIYSANFTNEWDIFIENSRNGTFLNSRRFLNYHPPEKFKDTSLLFFKKESLIALIPAAVIIKNEKKVFFSDPGSTYGGIIVDNSAKINDLQDIVNEIKHCVESHKGNEDNPPKTITAEIVANADAMAHFDVIPAMLQVALNKQNNNLEEAFDWLYEKIERDWNKKLTIPEARKMMKDKYDAIMLLMNSMKNYI